MFTVLLLMVRKPPGVSKRLLEKRHIRVVAMDTSRGYRHTSQRHTSHRGCLGRYFHVRNVRDVDGPKQASADTGLRRVEDPLRSCPWECLWLSAGSLDEPLEKADGNGPAREQRALDISVSEEENRNNGMQTLVTGSTWASSYWCQW